VFYLRFAEQDGLAVHDELGVQGTVGGGVDLDVPPLTACADDSAARFPGVSTAHVRFGDVLGFGGKSSFSVEVWLSADALQGMVIRKLAGAPSSGYTLAYYLDELAFRRYSNGDADTVAAASSAVGTWATHHVVGTYDGVAEQMCLYVGGELIECAASSRDIADGSGEFMIGTQAFAGAIDEVAVYAAPLSPERIARHFEIGAALSSRSGPLRDHR
jgi:hypothetical protein